VIDEEGARYQNHRSLLFTSSVSLVLMAAGYTEALIDDEGARRRENHSVNRARLSYQCVRRNVNVKIAVTKAE
jgi:hypothetical protein